MKEKSLKQSCKKYILKRKKKGKKHLKYNLKKEKKLKIQA